VQKPHELVPLTSSLGDVSRFKAGEFLASLVCLIPVQLGITRDNRFVSFYDGINDPEFEQSLLGASAQHIASRLSLGHLESILGNLYSTADVKVVSSLGEQSTGKSFALNHLLDTSFEGAATRTTEGVWMSVVPSSGATVYVVLDFEGVQSVERSVQEDALLVLMNAAISNLVIYRNSFSLSREIRTLFGAFQASAGILNPTANPELFRGSLAVVIKDVMVSSLRRQRLPHPSRCSHSLRRCRTVTRQQPSSTAASRASWPRSRAATSSPGSSEASSQSCRGLACRTLRSTLSSAVSQSSSTQPRCLTRPEAPFCARSRR
jgi:hypothetical protein